jgi:protein gp37
MATRLAANQATPQYHGLVTAGQYNGTVRLVPKALAQLSRWHKPRRIFVCSMGDLFHPLLPDRDILPVLDAMEAAPHHTYLLLTKRPHEMARVLALWRRLAHTEEYGSRLLPANWWCGVTACTSQEWWEGLRALLTIHAAVCWVSVEPILGPIYAAHAMASTSWCQPDWVVCGGETGPRARRPEPHWVEQLFCDCRAARVPYYAKRVPAGWTGDAFTCRELPVGAVDGAGEREQ